MIEALTGLGLMMLLAFMRVPIALAMGLVGFLGLWWMRGIGPSMASATTVVYESGFQYTLSVVPLFILMGNFVTRAGMSKELYRAAYTFVGHLRGGLAMATVLACAGFGAICGSSIATAATMTKVAYPSMRLHGYADTLSVGVIAAGGTLGILIPPSTIMVIYGIMTETSIGKLFAAGVLPGLLAVTLLCGAVVFANFVNFTSMPTDLKAFVSQYQISPITVMIAICVIYVILGTAMEELSMILLTVPVFFPLVVGLGFDPVWFGIIIVVVVQIGLISPPVGMNMFVVKSMLSGVSTATVFRGVAPFVVAIVVLLALLVAFPSISLFLPKLMRL